MKRTDQHVVGANNHSPPCTLADIQLSTLKACPVKYHLISLGTRFNRKQGLPLGLLPQSWLNS
jgi:hypothetical protein